MEYFHFSTDFYPEFVIFIGKYISIINSSVQVRLTAERRKFITHTQSTCNVKDVEIGIQLATFILLYCNQRKNK